MPGIASMNTHSGNSLWPTDFCVVFTVDTDLRNLFSSKMYLVYRGDRKLQGCAVVSLTHCSRITVTHLRKFSCTHRSITRYSTL